ncbi:hypothetical protein CAPTEDRAFT_191808 [Capitella teleta]|uniref:THAP-type domain-containing protein n=1 Tax=Capitella teleta TaxID=283909 RepID=R7TXX1_CAPTE|nr:hypothetical protein CAPTEDRAFT_211796 [Capitella teleta]ELT98763.1 hypothetical protein CAPTEDRAFT_191808 [Capitella teleta]|eukprot:ELT87772.1 hypothetical protein CAPTEDRAFT_211796 [Capitella teleta]
MHKFPDSHRNRERCLKWLAYLRSDHLNVENIKNAKVCSCHLEPEAYNCPTNIENMDAVTRVASLFSGSSWTKKPHSGSRPRVLERHRKALLLPQQQQYLCHPGPVSSHISRASGIMSPLRKCTLRLMVFSRSAAAAMRLYVISDRDLPRDKLPFSLGKPTYISLL